MPVRRTATAAPMVKSLPAAAWNAPINSRDFFAQRPCPGRADRGNHLRGVQGEGGFIAPAPRDAFKKLQAICRKENEVLMIADEVQTGISQTGTMFAMEQYGAARSRSLR